MSSKPPFARAEQVLVSLGRYAYRIALSNDRLVALQDRQVTFRWKDRAHGNAPRLATLAATTVLRRFLLHVLPRRFVRIRHYGFLANPLRPQKLLLVRQWLAPAAGAAAPSPAPRQPERWEALLLRLTGKDVTQCPRCGVGPLLVVETLPAVAGPGDPSRRARSPLRPSSPARPPNPPRTRPHSASPRSPEPAASCRPSSSRPRQAPGLADAAHFRAPPPGLPRSRRSTRSIIPHRSRPGRPSAGGFVQGAFFAHRAARRHEKALFIFILGPPPQGGDRALRARTGGA